MPLDQLGFRARKDLEREQREAEAQMRQLERDATKAQDEAKSRLMGAFDKARQSAAQKGKRLESAVQQATGMYGQLARVTQELDGKVELKAVEAMLQDVREELKMEIDKSALLGGMPAAPEESIL